MIRLIQRRLIIPRGDTGTFSLPVSSSLNIGDIAVFTIFDIMKREKIYQKIIEPENNIINIQFKHGDTVNLPVGKYYWDIKFYQNPKFVDDELVDGDEIDSYYSAYSLPVCEIRQTGDDLLTADDAPTSKLDPSSINIINALINETKNNKNAAVAASEAIQNMGVEASSLASNLEATVTKTVNPNTGAVTLSFGIPKGTSPTIEVTEITNGHRITITDVNGTESFDILEAYSPSASVNKVNNTTTITITDKNGTTTANINDGAGVPTGGTAGQVLKKKSSVDYDTEWGTDESSPVQDVQIDGTSILNNGIANVPVATASNSGIVAASNGNYGVIIGTNGNLKGVLLTNEAVHSDAKTGLNHYKPIVAAIQHESAFYGLAKAAGDTTQSQSSNVVGAYTNEAKAAIQQMLDVPSNSDIPTQVSELTNDAGYLTTETDPTVPAWAKAAQKPSYTAAEVGAPTVAEMNTAIGTAIGQINSFDMAIVQTLPTQNISTHTIYLVPKTGETNDVYDEYVYINNNWEMIGNTQIDLSNYVQKTDYATNNEAGVIKVAGEAYGVFINNNGVLYLAKASDAQVSNGTNNYKPIVPSTQHISTFYGLAKAAGVESQSAVGTYNDEAKAAIQHMIGTDTNLAPYEADTTSDAAYAIGEMFMLNGKLHQATAAIAVGDTLTVGTNCAVVNAVDVFPHDVQVNGASVLSNGVANVPVASSSTVGVVRADNYYGVDVVPSGSDANMLRIRRADSSHIKAGTNAYKPIAPVSQHESTFYGLAKAAGDTSQSASDNAVGQYTDAAKAAIQKMLGIYEAPWELIREDTFTNATEADYILSVDALGQPFELTDLILYLWLPTQSENAGVGDYGRVYLYNDNSVLSTVYLNNLTPAPVTTAKGAVVRSVQDNGLNTIDYIEWATRAGHQPMKKSIYWDFVTANPFIINSKPVTSILIKKVTGTMGYRILGRRKWN